LRATGALRAAAEVGEGQGVLRRADIVAAPDRCRLTVDVQHQEHATGAKLTRKVRIRFIVCYVAVQIAPLVGDPALTGVAAQWSAHSYGASIRSVSVRSTAAAKLRCSRPASLMQIN
jgi:hypothetical protein